MASIKKNILFSNLKIPNFRLKLKMILQLADSTSIKYKVHLNESTLVARRKKLNKNSICL